MLPEEWRNVRRLLVMRLDNIGDVVMLSPALRSLRAALPQAHITLMASPAGSQVAPLLPWVDELLTYRVVWQDASGALPLDPARELELVQLLHDKQFDAALIFTSFSQSPWPPAYACYLAGIPYRLGQSKEFGGSLLTQWVKSLPDSAHQVDRNLHLLTVAGLPTTGTELELHIPAHVQAETDQLLREKGIEPSQPFVLIAPGASCPARRYDPLRFGEVARQLGAHFPVVVAGSAKEKSLMEQVIAAAQTSGLVGLAGETDLPHFAAVVRRSHLLVANDSGPMHLADAFRRPMVILYSGTELESQWQPRHTPAKILRRPTDCSPCHLFECPFNMECLDIPAAEVTAHALNLLTSQTATLQVN